MLVYYMAIWSILSIVLYILWPFGIFYGYLVYFSQLVICTENNLATLVSKDRRGRHRRRRGAGLGRVVAARQPEDAQPLARRPPRTRVLPPAAESGVRWADSMRKTISCNLFCSSIHSLQLIVPLINESKLVCVQSLMSHNKSDSHLLICSSLGDNFAPGVKVCS
jgi:hypothetical protein